MQVDKKTFGTTRDGREVYAYTLDTEKGFSCTVISYGATLLSFRMPDREGRVGEITCGFDSLSDYEERNPYFGSTIGRFANRIGGARFVLDGVEYRLVANEGANQLHGGPGGFHAVVWESEAFSREDAATVVLSYRSPDGDQGFPGNLEVTASYTLTEEGHLILEYAAETDRPTPVNLTNHAYWNLSGPGSGLVLDHLLTLRASYYLEVDEGLIPTGRMIPVEGTPFDFREEKPIGRDFDEVKGGYDHCFVVDGEGFRQVAVVREPSTGRRMEVWSTKPGVQFYTGNHLNDIEIAGGVTVPSYGAFCLETQYFPDSPNKPVFPPCILRPGETYRHRTELRFSVE
ncbi:aldose epimerase family protein [Spirochaeta thermophila]|nr:aldose epimerase family protein [Spirochaeta thermophila]